MVTWLWVLVRGGADCAWERPVSDVGIWKNFLFYVACLVALFALGYLDTSPSPSFLSVCSGVWVLPVEYSVLDFSGRVRCLVQQWTHVLREALDEFQHFLRCGELEPWGVCSPFGLNGEVCTVDASGCSFFLSAVRTLEVERYFYERSNLGSLWHFSSPRCCLFSWVQCLVRQWTQFMRVLWLLDVFHTFSTLRQTRILIAFLLHSV